MDLSENLGDVLHICRYLSYLQISEVHTLSDDWPIADSADPPPSIYTDTDHSQPLPKDDGFDSRQDQAAVEAAIADFLKRLEVQGKREYRDLEAVLSRLLIPRKVETKLELLSQLLWKQVCSCAWRTRRVTSPPLKCFYTSMPKKIAVC